MYLFADNDSVHEQVCWNHLLTGENFESDAYVHILFIHSCQLIAYIISLLNYFIKELLYVFQFFFLKIKYVTVTNLLII